MEAPIDNVTSNTHLRTEHSETYIKIPYQIWKWTLRTWLTLGISIGLLSILMEFILWPMYRTETVRLENYFDWLMLVLFVAGLNYLICSIFSFVLLYRNWKVIKNAKSLSVKSAGEAVGLLFVPLFNIYWQFIAYPKLSIGQEKFIRQANIEVTRAPKSGLALAFCICRLIPYIGQVTSMLVLGPLTVINQSKVSMEIIRKAGN